MHVPVSSTVHVRIQERARAKYFKVTYIYRCLFVLVCIESSIHPLLDLKILIRKTAQVHS